MWPQALQLWIIQQLHKQAKYFINLNSAYMVYIVKGVIAERGCTYRDFRRVEIYVVDSAAGKVSPAWGEPLFDGLERYIEVDDCVHTVGVVQSFWLGYGTRETW